MNNELKIRGTGLRLERRLGISGYKLQLQGVDRNISGFQVNGRIRSCRSLLYYYGTCLDGLGKITEITIEGLWGET